MLYFNLKKSPYNDMYSYDYGTLVPELEQGKITALEFLEKAGVYRQYKKWCEEAGLETAEDSALLFYDLHGFKESEEGKEFIEPLLG